MRARAQVLNTCGGVQWDDVRAASARPQASGAAFKTFADLRAEAVESMRLARVASGPSCSRAPVAPREAARAALRESVAAGSVRPGRRTRQAAAAAPVVVAALSPAERSALAEVRRMLSGAAAESG